MNFYIFSVLFSGCEINDYPVIGFYYFRGSKNTFYHRGPQRVSQRITEEYPFNLHEILCLLSVLSVKIRR
jgi:hypothetical protein